MKKFLSVLVCFILIISCCSVPSSAIAIEIVGGSYVAYAVLAAALAAAGYTVATSDVSPEVFQGILDMPNAELVKALIGGTSMYLSAKGQVYFNWTASEWATFTNWVNSALASGSLVLPNANPDYIINTDFNTSLISSYIEQYIPTTSGIIGYYINGKSCFTMANNNGSLSMYLTLSNGQLKSTGTAWQVGQSCYMFGSPIYFNYNGVASATIGVGVNASGNIVSDRSQIDHCNRFISGTFSNAIINGHTYSMYFYNNRVYINNVAINGTSLYPTLYNTYQEWWTDVINTGALVGDLTGLGADVVNPGESTLDVGIDAYPPTQVGIGEDALPLDLDVGSTIDIPLDRYIDTPIDLSQDPVPIDFTPWQDKTIDTVPDDVIPDVRINPTTDIPSNPDIPWADTESYPIDYPIDTDTTDLPSNPNPNPEPDGDDANKLKLLPLVLSKFPFCLPWDLYHGVNCFFVSAEAPVFDIPLRSQTAGINETIHIDFNNYSTLASVSRWFFSALWVIILIMITRKIIWK